MSEETIKTIRSKDSTKRIVILRRQDGLYSFAVEKFFGRTLRQRSKALRQHRWIRGKLDPSIYETPKVAEGHARRKLADLLP
jgi:hypothetical protein